jgi:hypothetical protein
VTTLQAKLGGDRTARLDTLAQLVDVLAAADEDRPAMPDGEPG